MIANLAVVEETFSHKTAYFLQIVSINCFLISTNRNTKSAKSNTLTVSIKHNWQFWLKINYTN